MRETLRPVTLKRIVEVAGLCHQRNGVNKEEIRNNLDLSENRAGEILAEMERTSLIEDQDGEFHLSSTGERLWKSFEDEDWGRVHEVLYENSPHYQAFIDCLESHGEKHGLTDDELLESLEGSDDRIRFNKTGLDLVTDWGERLGAVQRNVFQDRYYSVTVPRDESGFVDVLQDTYSEMEEETGINLKQRYVSIPEIREQVCEKIRITRDRFDQRLTEVYLKNIGRMELSGAPLDTQAKESRFGIKTISRDEDEGEATTRMVSDRVLDGVTIEGKMYYYLAIFEQLMEEDA